MQFRNFVLRLAVDYLVLSTLLLLPGIQIGDELFAVWVSTLVFVLLTLILRPLLLALTLPLTILSAGLFIFVIDGVLLLITASVTSLQINGLLWAIVGGLVIGIANIWIQSAFRAIGWLDSEDSNGIGMPERPGIMLRLLLILALVIGIVFSLAMSIQVFLSLATILNTGRLIMGLSFLVLFMLSGGIAWLIAESLAMERRVIFSGLIGLLTVGSTLGALWAFILQPGEQQITLPEPRSNTAYWDLPTGSRIAYWRIKGEGTVRDRPIIVLHGGPGMKTLDHDLEFYGQFAQLGYDVYLYDQIGSGLSDHLDRIRDYSIERNIEDLDAIRAQIDTEEIILIAHAEGAELATRYLSRFPERVGRFVLHSPSPLLSDETFFDDYTRTAAPLGPLDLELGAARPLAAALIAEYGPDAAENLAPEDEMATWMQRTFNPGVWVCAGQPTPSIDTLGFNYYVFVRVDATSRQAPDPRPPLNNNLTPVLILASECDYQSWETVLQYQETFINDLTFYIEDAGHRIDLSQPELMHDIIRAFLTDAAYPINPYRGQEDPRPIIPRQ
ncbi:MAG: alpha/beta fold hydrolase [Chloroflexi bacterium]|nr:alpha/beta fold hydrolase [Chloroflexota bacterium]